MITRGHYELGIEGLALLRAGVSRNGDSAARLVSEIEVILPALGEPPLADPRELDEHDVETGYAGWAAGYDDPGNDTIAVEEPVVHALLVDLPEGPLLDAACGTGRHAAHLATAGRDVVGIDASEAMLRQARRKLPDVNFRQGELSALPLADGAVVGAVCALALSHLPELGPAVDELARVLRPGGRLIVSNPHPFATGILNWGAVYTGADGRRIEIPEYPHLHADYVAAFSGAGLVVRRLIEPALTATEARARAKLGREDAYQLALEGIPAVVVWEVEKAPVESEA